MKYKTRFILYIVLLVMVLFIMYMIRTQILGSVIYPERYSGNQTRHTTDCNGLYSDKLLHI